MQQKETPKSMYTPREAAAVSGLHYHTILTYIKAGHIEVMKLPSGYYRITADSLQKFLDSLKVVKAGPKNKKTSHHRK